MYLHSPNDNHVEIPRVGLTVERLKDRETEGEVVTHGAEDSSNRRHLKTTEREREREREKESLLVLQYILLKHSVPGLPRLPNRSWEYWHHGIRITHYTALVLLVYTTTTHHYRAHTCATTRKGRRCARLVVSSSFHARPPRTFSGPGSPRQQRPRLKRRVPVKARKKARLLATWGDGK